MKYIDEINVLLNDKLHYFKSTISMPELEEIKLLLEDFSEVQVKIKGEVLDLNPRIDLFIKNYSLDFENMEINSISQIEGLKRIATPSIYNKDQYGMGSGFYICRSRIWTDTDRDVKEIW